MRTWSRTGSRTSVRTFDRTESGGLPPVVSDPDFEYTTLLLPGNGTNGAQNNTFLDSSANAFSITRNGNTTQGTFSPFSQTGWGNYFDGTGDYLSVAGNSAFDFGTGDFTIEMWVYFNSYASSAAFLVGQNFFSSVFQLDSNGYLQFYSQPAAGYVVTGATAVPKNQWTHVALTRSGNTFRVFLNGNVDGTGTNSSAAGFNSGYELRIAAWDTLTATWVGYISNFRIVKGTAVYTANFTPSTTPLTAISGTSLLTCQSNRFVDNSSNAFAITRNGDVSVQAFSPFNPTAAWSAATYGGSGYFDGSGDYLTLSGNPTLTTNFTIEFWFYMPSWGDRVFLSQGGGAASFSTSNGVAFQIYSTSTTFYVEWSNGAGSSDNINTATSGIATNAWHHVAIGNNGTTTRVWIDGASVGTDTGTPTWGYPTTRSTYIGYISYSSSYVGFGYMAGVRMVTSDVYGANNSSITVPTAPPTAISNTQLLCNFTNAGIYDATSKNDLETVGNAQISTTQSKFGGSSMYFDGTGDWLLTQAVLGASDSGDFTVEGWFYINAAGSFYPSIQYYAATTDIAVINFNNGSSYYAALGADTINGGNAATITNASSTVSGQTWNHVAWARYGSTITFYINGLASGTLSLAYKFQPMKLVGVSYYSAGSSPGFYQAFNGYINDLRVTKGIARYTSNFTPPTTAFPVL